MFEEFIGKQSNIRGKQMVSAVALVLLLTISTFMAATPIANAHDPSQTIPTWIYVNASNNPIGVNQQTILIFWANAVPPTAFGAYGDRWTFTVDVTKPDGAKETLGPFTSDPVGGGYALYTPTQVGTYTIVAKFAEHRITGEPVGPMGGNYMGSDVFINDTYSASASDPMSLTVQQGPIVSWSETPLPTEYWTRPINNANRDWYVLAGNWLGGAAQNVGATTNFGYGEGPESAHVMWATPMWSGGVMDARFGDTGYQTQHYEGLSLTPPIILDGKIYYNTQSLPREGWYCLDLYTGETLYFHNTTGPVTGAGSGPFDSSGTIAGESLAFGQIFNYDSPNQHGGMPYLWSNTHPTQPNTWMMFDAFTGNYVCSIANVSAGGTAVYGNDGSILRYNIVGSGENKRLTVWNTTQAIWYEPAFVRNYYWLWRPTLNMTFDGNNGYSLNSSIPDVQGTIRAVRDGQYVIGGTSGKNNGSYVQQGNLWALNLKPDSNGIVTPTLLWNITFTPPQQASDIALAGGSLFGAGSMQGPTVDPEDGVFIFNEVLDLHWWGYSLETGEQLWGPTPSEPSLNFYGMSYNIYEGKLLTTGYGGVLMAYDIKTGNQLWNYTASQQGFESPYGNYPLSFSCIADGKIYLYSTEHSPTQPLWRGSDLRCVNASNGVELWKMLNWGGGGGIADGYYVCLNYYDNQIYCYGKGPSATTVEAAPGLGNVMTIKGTVTDQSAGAKEIAQKLGFTDGVPAVSDADQQVWMEYLYEQQACPANIDGVKVHLTAIDPNGNPQDIGYAISDIGGTFGISWTPPVEGTYQVTATFEGTKSYGSSYATTHFAVSETASAAVTSSVTPATSPSVAPQPASAMPSTTYITIGATIVIIIAAVAALLLRRRK